jgi:outer membrane protein assembly factor BamB
MRTRTLPALMATILITTTIFAADWPQWRGPDRTDVSREKGLLKSWPKDGPRLVWKFQEAGGSYSGPSIVGDRLYCCGSDKEREFVFAVNVRNGKQEWSTDFSKGYTHGRGDGPRGNPTVDGDHLYVLGGGGQLACLETRGGKLVWSKNLSKDLGGQMMSGWGYSESVLIDGDQLICTPGGKNGTLAALDKKTGDVLWRSKESTDSAAYSSVIIAEVSGVKQYVQMTGKGVIGVAPKDGKVLWHYTEGKYQTAVIPTPIYHENHVFITRGYGVGCDMIKLTLNADGTFKADKDYANKNMVNHHGGVILLGDYLYGYSDGKGWVCQDFKTGEIKWSDKKFSKGSVTFADGMLYCYAEGDGAVVLSEAGTAGWKEVGRFKIPETSKLHKGQVMYWTHPVVANGRLYIRDQDLLFCFDVCDGKSS